ncbi:unnamed protein product [Gordionus sp. m RMFG-2023]
MLMHYNDENSDSKLYHKGIRDVIFWDVPQIQHKNRLVQIVKVENMTPTPFIMFYLDGSKKMFMDVFAKSREEIMSHMQLILGKTIDELTKEAIKTGQIKNPANFGPTYPRECISEVPGQVFAPCLGRLPDSMRGKKLFPEGRMARKNKNSVWALIS